MSSQRLRRPLRAFFMVALAAAAQACGAYAPSVPIKLDPSTSFVSVNGSEPVMGAENVQMTFGQSQICVLQVFHPDKKPFYRELSVQEVQVILDRGQSIKAFLDDK